MSSYEDLDCPQRTAGIVRRKKKVKTSKTLSEIRKELGITRKAIQGYENNGLISSDEKDRYGRHVYDEETLKKIIEIRFYQKLGFSVKEIKKLIDCNDDQLREALIEKKTETADKIASLQRKRMIIGYLISSKAKPDMKFMLKAVKEEE